MLDYLFGFNARLGRLQFLLACIALAVVMTAICVAIAASGHFPRIVRGSQPSWEMLTWPIICATIFFVWATVNLYAMRLRDIGWDAVCVIVGWIAIVIVDGIIAMKVPSWSLGPGHHGTVLGSIVNLAVYGALLFWPSSDA